ncbi:hypothetical protein HRR83_004375 [Exophiala dermatitidis]|nr:hypothetical protein HRR73_006162 [Exophiala dermatitidis]KAJ4517666.1 hypothetical protein HRR75_002884 [Exophiala dermatitidis]KAJ4521320.1 hypothetical protein HRR74_003143 [Exophiala dermatitidis]KAJ4541987.1 hypothetical protein HRR77_005878 [Exophiala dermatitidis]KAJ4544752.1 hypothetical protein HRR76_002796 [Exophiala dermatitidis]
MSRTPSRNQVVVEKGDGVGDIADKTETRPAHRHRSEIDDSNDGSSDQRNTNIPSPSTGIDQARLRSPHCGTVQDRTQGGDQRDQDQISASASASASASSSPDSRPDSHVRQGLLPPRSQGSHHHHHHHHHRHYHYNPSFERHQGGQDQHQRRHQEQRRDSAASSSPSTLSSPSSSESKTYLLSSPTVSTILHPQTHVTISSLLLTPNTQLIYLVPQTHVMSHGICEISRLPRAEGSDIQVLPVPEKFEMKATKAKKAKTTPIGFATAPEPEAARNTNFRNILPPGTTPHAASAAAAAAAAAAAPRGVRTGPRMLNSDGGKRQPSESTCSCRSPYLRHPRDQIGSGNNRGNDEEDDDDDDDKAESERTERETEPTAIKTAFTGSPTTQGASAEPRRTSSPPAENHHQTNQTTTKSTTTAYSRFLACRLELKKAQAQAQAQAQAELYCDSCAVESESEIEAAGPTVNKTVTVQEPPIPRPRPSEAATASEPESELSPATSTPEETEDQAVNEVVRKILRYTKVRKFDGFLPLPFQHDRASWLFLERVGRDVMTR